MQFRGVSCPSKSSAIEPGLHPASWRVLVPFALGTLPRNTSRSAASWASLLRPKSASVTLRTVLGCFCLLVCTSNSLWNRVTPGFSAWHLKEARPNQRLPFVHWKQLPTEKTRTRKVGQVQACLHHVVRQKPQTACSLTSNFLLDTHALSFFSCGKIHIR